MVPGGPVSSSRPCSWRRCAPGEVPSPGCAARPAASAAFAAEGTAAGRGAVRAVDLAGVLPALALALGVDLALALQRLAELALHLVEIRLRLAVTVLRPGRLRCGLPGCLLGLGRRSLHLLRRSLGRLSPACLRLGLLSPACLRLGLLSPACLRLGRLGLLGTLLRTVCHGVQLSGGPASR